jgi:membrane-bound inhibitor of C-type lysozyme
MNTNSIIYLIIAVALIIGGIIFIQKEEPVEPEVPVATVSYMCSANNTITAAYFAGSSEEASSDRAPKPSGHVELVLPDGRPLSLPQTISASGARYANASESIIFWNNGRSISYTDTSTETDLDCIEVSAETSLLTQVYINTTRGISVRYPNSFTADETYTYSLYDPDTLIPGVRFTIPNTLASGTNLSADTYISVEELPTSQTCTADQFLNQTPETPTQVVDNGTSYSVATITDAGASNRYEETVYAFNTMHACMAVRYMVHYTVLENYPEGTITAYDKESLRKTFDAVRRSLIVSE